MSINCDNSYPFYLKLPCRLKCALEQCQTPNMAPLFCDFAIRPCFHHYSLLKPFEIEHGCQPATASLVREEVAESPLVMVILNSTFLSPSSYPRTRHPALAGPLRPSFPSAISTNSQELQVFH